MNGHSIKIDKVNGHIKEASGPKMGIVEWIHLGDYQRAESLIEDLDKININLLRTGISWADLHTAEGKKWYRWLVPKLSSHVEILPCFLYTPPSMGLKPKTSAPPVNLKAYADTLDTLITEYGNHFEYIELWNEPNNKSEWDYTLDPGWRKFAEMIGGAAYWAKQKGKKTVLGGMSPVDPNWLDYMFSTGITEYIDVVGFHGFPDVFDSHWDGWEEKINLINRILKNHNADKKVWITEAGFSTWQHNEFKQLNEFQRLLDLPVERAYWYGMYDLDPERETIDGFHLDEREYFFGLKSKSGKPKLLYRLWANNGIEQLKQSKVHLNGFHTGTDDKYVMITGGSGFIGTNLAERIIDSGRKVLVYDNLSRDGVEKNYDWLKKNYKDQVQIEVADVRDFYTLKKAVKKAEMVFHFAAQVAVTTSLTDPIDDFGINVKGTVNLLEAIRSVKNPPPLAFTSTNKVYGGLEDVVLELEDNHYIPIDPKLRKHGVKEDRNLDFHSPYGCSKGAADQYVLDYSRIYDLQTVVFRMSCIYGYHQFGTEDQGWVANFLIRAIENQPIHVYGDGRQVRDLLMVDDLVNAFMLAEKNIAKISGNAFNIGGGTQNAVSVLEVLQIIEELQCEKLNLQFSEWRPGDQRYYVSDTRKFEKATGWSQEIGYKRGIAMLYHWLLASRGLKTQPLAAKEKALTSVNNSIL